MGSICPKKIPPYEAKNVTELAEKVVDKIIETKKGEFDNVISVIETSCAQEFWKHWRMKDKDDKGVEVNKKMFLFLVLVSWLDKMRDNRGQSLEILTSLKKEIFTDPDMVECTVHFQDVHSKVFKIYTSLQSVLAPQNGVILSGVLNELIQNLTTLKSDPIIKDELDSTYKMFLKEMSLKPSRKAQQCLLSLL